MISVIYRMALASVLLFAWCRWQGIPLRLKSNDHTFLVAQGICLFGLNYWMIYWSETYLPSGIIAVLFSLIVFFNIINARIFLGRPYRLQGNHRRCDWSFRYLPAVLPRTD